MSTGADHVIRASAGSGKTFRLTNHYIARLADGDAPAQLWAATFTRKAAGEILSRIVERLAAAAASTTAARELAKQIERSHLQRADFTRLLRLLFEHLHRLRIGTLDSLFLQLAGCFTLECALPPGWSIVEEVEAQADREAALDAVLSAEPDRLSWLADLLRGEAHRGVRSELLARAEQWYAAYRTVPYSGWQCEAPPPPTEPLPKLLDQLMAVDLGRDKRMTAARNEDCERARTERWDEFSSKGLAAKVCDSEADLTYYGKPIPPELVAGYFRVKAHAEFTVRSELAAELAALWRFLDEYHRHREARLRRGGGLRFDDITWALGTHLRPGAHGFDYRIDGRIAHLLLDEFQDTSTSQWLVLRELAHACRTGRGTFFAVGDVKQAIYGWRGGRVELLQRLPEQFDPPLPTLAMDQSRRSAPVLIALVNTVFSNAANALERGPWSETVLPWNGDFRAHSTVHPERAGHVCIHTGPAREEKEAIGSFRARHYAFVAKRIAELARAKPSASIGVLCRTNDAVGGMLFELRHLGVPASEEGGNPIDDSAAVELLLSLLTLADHPGDAVAAFHLQHSPLSEELARAGFGDRFAFASQLRAALVAEGYAAVLERWAAVLRPLCPPVDRLRLTQLIERADAYAPRATLRPAEFVAWLRAQAVAAPTDSRIRVLTLHKAKGLEFDAVVLPQLDEMMKAKSPPEFVVVEPDPPRLPSGFFARRVNKKLMPLVAEATQQQIAVANRREFEESLSLLYVALTRPRFGLYAFPPGPEAKKRTDYWDTLLLRALGLSAAADTKTRPAEAVVYEQGDPNWQPKLLEGSTAAPPPVPRPIRLSPPAAQPRRVEWVAPSGLEARRTGNLASLFADTDSTGRDIGTLHHAWFETITWLDDGEPSDEQLRARAAVIPYTRDDLDEQLRDFRQTLTRPEVRQALSKPSGAVPLRVDVERPFTVRDGPRLVNGIIDRLVWLKRADGTASAEVYDYKTDRVTDDTLHERVEHHRPQMEAYIRAVASFGALPPAAVTATLVFTRLGRTIRLHAPTA